MKLELMKEHAWEPCEVKVREGHVGLKGALRLPDLHSHDFVWGTSDDELECHEDYEGHPFADLFFQYLNFREYKKGQTFISSVFIQNTHSFKQRPCKDS